MKKDKRKEPECPLCEVSQETLEKLKEKGKESKKKRFFLKNPMIWFLIIVVVLGGLAFYKFFLNFSSTDQNQQSINQKIKTDKEIMAIGEKAPDFVSEDVFGNKISLSDFRNKKPVLLVFWATWCGYCAQELPDLKIFTAKYKNEIQIIAVDSGESQKTIEDYIKEEDINFPVLLDEKREIWNQYSIRGTPSHFLIDKKGEIITLRPGLALLKDLETMLSMLE